MNYATLKTRIRPLLVAASLAFSLPAAATVILNGPAANDIDTTGVTTVGATHAAAGTIADLDVNIHIVADFASDMTVRLRHQNTGTTVTLWNSDNGNQSFFDVFVTLDDESSQIWTGNGNNPGYQSDLTGTRQPQNPLSAFDGESLAGTWQLLFQDSTLFPNEGDDLISWSLVFTERTTTGPTPTPEPGSLALLGLGLLGIGYRRFLPASSTR